MIGNHLWGSSPQWWRGSTGYATLNASWKLIYHLMVETLEGNLSRGMRQLRGKDLLKEVPRAQRYVARPSLVETFKEKKGKSGKRKDEITYRAYADHGYRMGEIAEHLGVHYTSISRAIRRVENFGSRRARM